MSNIFITEIVGASTYAIPTNDAELAAATAGFNTILSGVANLAYDRVLAWVEDAGGPDGAEGVRSLNCLVEKFTYLAKECPDESQVDTMTAAIEAALEADVNITSIGQQQVHIFQAGAYFLWNRDAAGGFLYPTTTTDDVAVGGHVAPTGKWFDDGDLVLGAAAMSGAEKLRVVGSQRIDTNGQLLIVDSATIPPLNLTERSAAPAAPNAGDIYVDDGTNTGSGSPGWRRYTGAVWEDMGALASSGVSQWNEQNIVHVAPHGDDANNGDAINLAKLTIASAITRATALTPTANNRITVLIHPGEYDEGITTANSYVDFIGVDRDACILKPTGAAYINITDDNVRISNLTLDKTSTTQNFSLYVSSSTDIEIDYLRVIMDGDGNDEVSLRGVSGVIFRDCIFEDTASEGNLILDDNSGGTYRFFNCIFKGYISLLATYYFYNCHFQANGTPPVIGADGSSPNIFRMFCCTVRRSGATNGDGIRISTSTLDWGIIGCDIDAAVGTGADDILCLNENPGILQGNIIGTRIAESVKLKSVAHRFVGVAGGPDIYDSLLDALDSLPVDGGVVELTDNYDTGVNSFDPRSGTTGKVILEGNGFEITGTSLAWADTIAGATFELRNLKLDEVGVRLGLAGTIVLRNVQMYGGSYVLINVGCPAGAKIVMDNVDIDGTDLGASEYPIRNRTTNAAQILINNSSFTGRNAAGSNGAAVYFTSSGVVFRAINSLFVHQVGGVGDYEIDAAAAQTVYTQYCMTRNYAIGAAANITEGIGVANYNIVDANAGFLWRD